MKTLNRFAGCSIIAISLISSAAIAQDMKTQKNDEARSRSIRQSYREKKEDGLNLVVYLVEGEQETPVDPAAHTFKKGDQLRIKFRSNFDGFVYFVNIDPSGDKSVIYPDLGFKDHQNQIRADTDYRLPGEDILKFEDEVKGTEILQVIMARQPVSFLEDAIKNAHGVLGKTKANAASELASAANSQHIRVLPDKGEGAVRSRSIRLDRPKDRDKEGAFVTVPDKQLKPGEVAVFQILLPRN